ncbi:hypothetical protein MAM1_0185c07496 [Mucor ambiguus]|uniref:Uncharacterized protein n=1 Tax=Mucor ambiguus TaxID=91626 RepID=A0A0C9MBL0_9FUNG|nr:hypothetical protein MAM1_0185c07496 [Mucor ambiguus]
MLTRMKFSLLGALGSFVTVVLMYHILQLSTRETFSHYFQPSPLLAQSYHHNSIDPESPPLQQTTPTSLDLEAYNLDKLKSTFMTPIPSNISTTVIIKYDSLQLAITQLDALLRQSMPPRVIYMMCSEKERPAISSLIQEKKQEFRIANVIQPIVMTRGSSAPWYSQVKQYGIITDFVVLLDNNRILPGKEYVEFAIRLLHSATFRNTLVGTENSNECQQTNNAHYVKLIQDVWVLRREWFLALLSSPSSSAGNVSLDLYQTLQIPSILIPSDGALTGNTNRRANTCVDESLSDADGSVVFYMEDQPTSAMEALMCQLGVQQTVYMMTDSAQIQPPACSTQKANVQRQMVFSRREFGAMVNQLQAQIVIYQENNKGILHETGTATMIHLPTSAHYADMAWMTTLSTAALKHWHTPSVKLIITTSGGKKSAQVKRIFNSIKNADYLGDQVDISILMDEKSDGLTSKFVNNLQWSIGSKHIRHRISTVHPMQVFAEAWYPSSDHEYAVMLDDRVELSRSFYIWIKYNLLKYRYSQQQQTTNKHIFGVSLYSPRIIDTDPSGRLLLQPSSSSPYLMQVPCSSGALYFPQHWREFHDYITARLTDQAIVKRGSGNKHLFKDSLLTVSKTNRWINSWRKYFDEMIYMRGYVMLYPSIQSSYSTLHINWNRKQKAMYPSVDELYNVPLSRTLPASLPDSQDLPVLDLHGKPSNIDTLISKGRTLQRKFSACQPTNTTSQYDASDMLCPFNQLIQIPIDESIESVPIQSVNIYITNMPVNNGEGSEQEPQQQPQEKRLTLPKYATTTHSDKKIAPVSTTDFNKNLTVEKARFDSASSANIPHPPTASNSTPITPLAPLIVRTPPPVDDAQLDKSTHSTLPPPLTTSVTLPAVATVQSLSGASTPTTITGSTINTMPSQSTPLMAKSNKPTTTAATTKAATDDRRSTIKRKKLPPMSGTATPSEVFHRNLVDAVSNVEDSDENEQYVYPYSGNNTDSTYHMNSTDTIHRTTSSSLYRPQSTRSFINNSSQHDLLPTKSSSGFLGDLLRPILFKSKSDSKAIYKQQREEHFTRPKLRSYVMDHPYNQTTQTAKDWFDGKHSPPLYQGGSRRKMYSTYGIGGNDGGYTTDDEEAQHLLATHPTRRSQQQLQQQQHRKQINACRVLSSDKELIFDLHISAINSNVWTIHVAEADISIFAFSQVVPVSSLIPSPIARGVDPAEYLGGFYHFDEPLSFPSSLITKHPVTAISQIRIKSPGADKSGNERWSRIIRYPYGLVVRGVLKYRPLAFLSPYPQSLTICDVVRVNPTTDKVSEDPDQGFCLSYNNNHTAVVRTAMANHVNQTSFSN